MTLTRREFLVAGVAVAVAPLAFPAPLPAAPVVPVPVAQAEAVTIGNGDTFRFVYRLIIGEPEDPLGLRRPYTATYRRKSGREVLALTSLGGSMTQWVALNPDESIRFEPGDELEVEGPTIMTWHEPGDEPWHWRRFEPGRHVL